MIAPLIVAIWFLLSSPVWAAVACGNETSQNATTADPATVAYTPDAGSNRIVILAIHVQDTDTDAITISGVTSTAGGTFTEYGTAVIDIGSAEVRVALYYSTDFADGAQTLSADFSSAPIRSTLAAYTCTGINTASPFRAVAATATGTATTATVDVTNTVATDLVIDAMIAATLGAGVNPTVGAGQTQMYNIPIGTDNVDTGGSTEPGNGATVTMSWTGLTSVEGWATVAGALKEAATARRSGGPILLP